MEMNMRPTNHSFSTLHTTLLSTEDKQVSCFTDTRVWLIDQFIVLMFMHYFLLGIGVPLAFVALISSVRSDRFADTVTEDDLELIYSTEHQSYVYGTYRVLKKEIILVSVYVLSAFMYKWLVLVHDDNVITSMNIYQWSIEATFAPLLFASTYCCSFIDDELGTAQLYGHYQYRFIIMLKIPLFVLMRCAETFGSFFINEWRVSFFYSLCSEFRK